MAKYADKQSLCPISITYFVCNNNKHWKTRTNVPKLTDALRHMFCLCKKKVSKDGTKSNLAL